VDSGEWRALCDGIGDHRSGTAKTPVAVRWTIRSANGRIIAH
jgi:hypothetical protein